MKKANVVEVKKLNENHQLQNDTNRCCSLGCRGLLGSKNRLKRPITDPDLKPNINCREVIDFSVRDKPIAETSIKLEIIS